MVLKIIDPTLSKFTSIKCYFLNTYECVYITCMVPFNISEESPRVTSISNVMKIAPQENGFCNLFGIQPTFWKLRILTFQLELMNGYPRKILLYAMNLAVIANH